jgi:hypothetical protein
MDRVYLLAMVLPFLSTANRLEEPVLPQAAYVKRRFRFRSLTVTAQYRSDSAHRRQ